MKAFGINCLHRDFREGKAKKMNQNSHIMYVIFITGLEKRTL